MASTVVESLTPTGALVAYLEADAELSGLVTGVWADPAPQEATPIVEGQAPSVFVTVRAFSGLSHPCGGGSRYLESVYAVQVVGPAERIATIEAAAVRVDTVLGAVTGGSLAGWHVMGLWLDGVIEFPDPEDQTGIRWEHRGGTYRLLAETTG